MDYRAALTEFYRKYNPEKLREIDLLLAKYRGREEELLHALKVKYGAHKTEPQQPPSPQPPSQGTPPPKPDEHREIIQPAAPSEPTPKKEDARPAAKSFDNDIKEGPLSSATDKGRSAAERAEYWKRELEKREKERGGAEKSRNEKFTMNKSKKESPTNNSNEATEEVEENSDNRSGFPVKTILIALLAILLLGGVAYVLLNDNLRTSIGARLGLSTSSDQLKTDKKEGIDPDMVAQNKDSAVTPGSEGEFALDNEVETEGRSQEVEEAMSNRSETKSEPQTKGNGYDGNKTSGSSKVQGGLQRNYWYLSYISVSKESVAKKVARELQSQGYDNAGYYYIPDYDPKGKEMYKVYIGPYESVEGAEGALDANLNKINPNAYPYMLK